jgi:hypothetical protein
MLVEEQNHWPILARLFVCYEFYQRYCSLKKLETEKMGPEIESGPNGISLNFARNGGCRYIAGMAGVMVTRITEDAVE